MKLKINKQTIETILWLLGEIISLLRKISKENKGDDVAIGCALFANCLNRIKFKFTALKYHLENGGQDEKSIEKG